MPMILGEVQLPSAINVRIIRKMSKQWLINYYFANPNDKTGYWAEEHCLELAKLYEEEDETTDYICSTKVFEKYIPKVN